MLKKKKKSRGIPLINYINMGIPLIFFPSFFLNSKLLTTSHIIFSNSISTNVRRPKGPTGRLSFAGTKGQCVGCLQEIGESLLDHHFTTL